MKTGPDETAVAAANLAFYRALEARDLSAMDTVWLHDESATCVHPGWHRLDGWSEIRRSWENIFARRDGRWRLLHHHASPTSSGVEEEDQPVN